MPAGSLPAGSGPATTFGPPVAVVAAVVVGGAGPAVFLSLPPLEARTTAATMAARTSAPATKGSGERPLRCGFGFGGASGATAALTSEAGSGAVGRPAAEGGAAAGGGGVTAAGGAAEGG